MKKRALMIALSMAGFASPSFAGVGNRVHVNGDETHTLATYELKSGTVCVSIKTSDGGKGRVKVWTITNTGSNKDALYTGEACVAIKPAYAELRVGFVAGSPVDVTITREDLKSVEEIFGGDTPKVH